MNGESLTGVEATARGRTAAAAERRRRRTLACLAAAPWNPYLRLLHRHLRELGFEVLDDPEVKLGWLLRERASVGFLHLHWPESLYRFERGPAALRRLLSWVKLWLILVRLVAARALGYTIVWTVHQTRPHESTGPLLDRVASRLLGRLAHLLLVHDRATADRVRAELPSASSRLEVVPHGSYVGVYPEGRGREEVRGELGIAGEAFVFLCFGEIRANKGVEVLLGAFARAALPEGSLVVAGHAKDEAAAAAIAAAAQADDRLKSLVGTFLPDERVAELFGACDVAVVPRSDGGTSGSLLLACSLGLPSIVAAAGAAGELVRESGGGWTFAPGEAASLAAALEAAARDRQEALRRGRAAYAEAAQRTWPEIASRTARLLERTRA